MGDALATIREWLNQGWVGILIGGALGLFFYIRARNRPRLSYQTGFLRLLGGRNVELPKDIAVTFRGTPVERLSKAVVMVWNSGNTSLVRGELIASDPLRIETPEDGEILDVQIVRTTRAVIQAAVEVDKQHPCRALCSYEFMDPGDGFRVELLHTSPRSSPRLRGTIRGMRRGFSFIAAELSRTARRADRSRSTAVTRFVGRYFFFAFGAVILILGLSLSAPELFPAWFGLSEAPTLDQRGEGFTPIVMGLGVLGVAWFQRERFPRELRDVGE